MTYFKEEEFKCKCCDVSIIDEELLYMLNKARGLAGTAFHINSGYRCPLHNKIEGGKNTSSHIKGLACDIRTEGSSNRFKILMALIDVGFNRIGGGDNFIHVDIDPDKAPNVMWLY